jgi:Tfp pilus assembly protein PilF
MGQYDEASSWARRALQEKSDYLPAIRILAASEALAGHAMEAQRSIDRLRKLQPELRIADLKHQVPLRRPIDAAKYADGLRKAGLPE